MCLKIGHVESKTKNFQLKIDLPIQEVGGVLLVHFWNMKHGHVYIMIHDGYDDKVLYNFLIK